MTAGDSKVSLNRSPLAACLEDVEIVRLPRTFQQRLGCSVNEDVFLECPYVFAPRHELLDLARQANSPLQSLIEKITEYRAPDVLLGYAYDRNAVDDSGDFVVCLTEDVRDALIRHNRAITRELRRLVREEISKSAGQWRELGSAAELEQGFVKSTRPLHEIELVLPVAELRRRRILANRPPAGARDGYVELVPIHEDFQKVRYAVVAKATQTHLPSRNAEAQTYPGHPKNQWTQYEYEIDEGILEIWDEKVAEEEDIGTENDNEASTEVKEEQEVSEKELQLRETRRKAWEKLDDFLKSRGPDVLDAVSFNASTNLYTNDVVNLAGSDRTTPAFVQPYSDYAEKVSLIDLKTVGKMHLLAASWHYDLPDVIATAYLDKESKGSSLVALWSLLRPLRPQFILDCEDRLSMLSFCPLAGYTSVIVGGCLDGKIVVWEVNRQIFDNNAEEKMDSFAYESKEPEPKECKIAASAEKSQRSSITSLQWLPSWCHIESDGNYHRSPSDSPRERRAQFATTSTDSSVFFWVLPRTLSRPAQARSPLHLTTSPVYQLRLEESPALTGLCLPLAVSEESSTLSIRDQADLERLRRVFLGTSLGEVLCCGWEGQTFSVDVTDRETCSVLSRYCAHDGVVRAMVRSPHLDDVFLTVGGRKFALWKEDLAETPIFQRALSMRSTYADACWSLGRPGTFLLARMDGYIELWDLKRRADEPVLLQTVSGKSAQFLIPSPASSQDRLLAILDGKSTVRVLVEPQGANEEDLERLEWCEEFAWRETKRKLDFRRWQEEYLRAHPTALRRKAEREQAEANRRHREARERFLKILGIICMSCSSPTYSSGGWFVFVSVTAFIMTLIWCILYLFSIREALKLPINWILTELINTGIYTLLYFTAFVTQLAWAVWTAHIVAGVFGIFNTLAYGAGTYFLYLEHKNGQQ